MKEIIVAKYSEIIAITIEFTYFAKMSPSKYAQQVEIFHGHTGRFALFLAIIALIQ